MKIFVSPIFRCGFLWVGLSLVSGCSGPNYNKIANELREKNMAQERELAAVKEQLANRNATITMMREKAGPALATLSPERLAELFTVNSILLRPETRVDTWPENNQSVTGFRVFVRMMAKDGQLIPASGTMTIEAFELPPTPAEPRRIGTWTFTPADMKKCWYSGLGLDHFALNCPFTKGPTIREVTFKARFVDALTGTTLEAHLDKWLNLPAY